MSVFRAIRWSEFRDHVVFHQRWELALMRLLFAWLVFSAIQWEMIDYEPIDPDKANGPAKIEGVRQLIDAFSDVEFRRQIVMPLTGIALAFFVAGVVPHLALSVVCVVCVCMGTLENSQGWIGHTTQLVSMIVVALTAVYWVRPRLFTDSKNEVRAAHWAKVTIAASYVVCGLVKVFRSYGMWAWQSPWLALQFVKTSQQNYLNKLEPQGAETFLDRLPYLILDYPNLARLAFGAGLLLEICAFLVLIGRKSALIYGSLLVLFHLTISVAMHLDFENHIYAITIFLVNAPWWIWVATRNAGGQPLRNS